MNFHYDYKLLPNILHTKFLRINIDSALSWRTCIEQRVSKVREGIVTSWQMEVMPNIYCYSKLLHIQRLQNKAKNTATFLH
jgi:hypothetical protein